VTADVILIPKKLRAEWMDVIALDPKISNAAFRAAGVIGSHFNKHTGRAFPSQSTIAAAMGVSDRTAWAAVCELEREGYLVIQRRSLGVGTRMTKAGPVAVRFAGGKGVANTYLPAFERSQLTATNAGSKLATRCDLYWEQRSQSGVAKVATDCDLTLVPPSEVTLQGGNPRSEKQWVHRDDPSWPALNDRWRKERNPVGAPTDRGGGWHFPTQWVEEARGSGEPAVRAANA
jgi:hypothetical protein